MSKSPEEMLIEMARLAKASPAERLKQAESLARSGAVPPPAGTFLKARAQLDALKLMVNESSTVDTPQPALQSVAAPQQRAPAQPAQMAQRPAPRQPGVSPAPVVRGGAPQNPAAVNQRLLGK